MEHSALDDILILLAVAVVSVTLFRRLGLPAILGYLFVGLVAGPSGFGWVNFSDAVRFLGELGIVFLLFSIGLEFSLPLLLGMRRYLLGLGSVQVLVGTLAGFVIAHSFGVEWRGALVLGAATALSSTAIVLTQLAEQHELQERPGRLAVGILLFQDLAAVPFLVVIPLLASRNGDLAGILSLALLKAAIAFLVIWYVGRSLLPRLLHGVAQAASRELFTLTVLFLALATAWLTSKFGLSLAMGAFLAGMLLGETVYRHQIEADARPFRDLLMGLFFVTVGMALDYRLLPQMWLETTIVLVGITVGKGLLIVCLVWLTRLGLDNALRTGLLLGHGGEFGIALIVLALGHDVLSYQAMQPVLAAMILSMMIAAVLVRHNRDLARWLVPAGFDPQEAAHDEDLRTHHLSMTDHVVIAGFGRLGQNLATFLRKLDIPYVALDLDAEVIRQARQAGEAVFYGDCTRRDVLRNAGLPRARVMVVTFDKPRIVDRVLDAARTENRSLDILVRTRDDRDLEHFIGKGAAEVLPETLEASLALARHLLYRYDYAMADIHPLLESIRHDRYRELRPTFVAGGETREPSEQPRLQTVVLAEDAYAIGRRLDELALAEQDVSVVAIRRSGIRGDQPLSQTQLRHGDALVLEGTLQQLDAARRTLLEG